MSAARRTDAFILAARTYGLRENATRIFAMDAMIDYAAEQVREAASEARALALEEAARLLDESDTREWALAQRIRALVSRQPGGTP